MKGTRAHFFDYWAPQKKKKSTRELGETERGFISGCHRVPGIQMAGQTARDDDDEDDEDDDDAERDVFMTTKTACARVKVILRLCVVTYCSSEESIDRACYHTEE